MPFCHFIFRLPSKLRRRARRSRIALLSILLFVLISLVTPFYLVYKPPRALISYFQHRWPEVLFHVQTNQKIVALTIDDAPSRYTKDIRAILKANDATATFFVVGTQVEGEYAEIDLEDLIVDGSELGNHAMYDEPAALLSDEVLTNEIKSVGERISEIYKLAEIPEENHKLYFRPGSGFFSQRMLDLVKKLGYQLVLGSIYPHDPQIQYWRLNAAHILSMLRPGAIIICHDRRSWTLPMLRKVLPEIKRRGYKVVSISKLLEAVKT